MINAQTGTAFRGGNININADTFNVTGGGQVITTADSSGRAGNITLDVSDRMTLSGSDPNYVNRPSDRVSNQGAASGVFANTVGDSDKDAANGGNITIQNSDLLLLRNGGSISTNAGRNGGNIGINADFIVAVPNENSDISANAIGGMVGLLTSPPKDSSALNGEIDLPTSATSQLLQNGECRVTSISTLPT